MRPWSALRLAVVCGALLGIAHPAAAQIFDQPVLRGSTTYMPGVPVNFRWEGIYGGVTGSYASMNADFGKATTDLTNYILRNSVLLPHVQDWNVLPKQSTSGQGYGLFAGYNAQWDDAVLGFEVNYTRGPMFTEATDSLSLIISDNTGAPAGHNYQYYTTVDSKASVRMIEYATMRLRAGWAAGRFMPYLFGGVAVGRADTTRYAKVTAILHDSYVATTTVTDPNTGQLVTVSQDTTDISPLMLPPAMSVTKKQAFTYGVAGGLGIDVALLPNTFLRGEWEYIKFAPISGMRVSVNTFRTGVAVKF